jgi:hypothetical protein
MSKKKQESPDRPPCPDLKALILTMVWD